MAPKRGWIWSEPGCSIAQISGERWGVATADEDAIGVHGAFPLSMGVWKGRADVIEQV